MQIEIPQDLTESFNMLSALTGKDMEAIVSDALHEFMDTTGSPMIDMLVGEPDGGLKSVPITFARNFLQV